MINVEEEGVFDSLFTDLEVEEEPEVLLVPERKKQIFKEAVLRPASRSELFLTPAGEDVFGALGERPAYEEHLKSVPEILDVAKDSPFTAISTFSGCGGSALGVTWGGFRELAAVEFVKAARDTYAANFPSALYEPELIADEISAWIEENPNSPLLDHMWWHKPSINRGLVFESTFDWEGTLISAAESEDDDVLEAAENFRYEITKRTLARLSSQGKSLVWGDDIRGLDGKALLEALGLKEGELSLFEGSPPCKSFSMIGSRAGGWGKISHYSDERKQSTEGLFFEYYRLLSVIKPKTFLAENVAGIDMGFSEDSFLKPLLAAFRELGYRVAYRKLSSANHGVPQSRPRVFIMGVRNDLVDKDTGEPLTPQWPEVWPYTYTLQEALDVAGEPPLEQVAHFWIGGYKHLLERIGGEENLPEVSWAHDFKIRLANGGSKRSIYPTGEIDENDRLRYVDGDPQRYGIGEIWHQLSWGQAPESKAFQLMRCHPHRYAPTIPATAAENVPAAGPVHPHEPRKFTVPELKSIFSFPNDYEFTGTFDQQGERIGRSVTPLLMKQIADKVREILERAA